MKVKVKKIKLNKHIQAGLLNIARCCPCVLSITKFQPRSITISLVSRCNLRCIMCNYWKSAPKNELTTQKVKDILKQAKELGCASCCFYGGEPMMRSDIFELIKYAHNLGFKVNMISNGYLIEAKRASMLAESGLNDIVISIDALGDIHDEIRGMKGCFEKAIVAIQELRKNHINVTVASLLMKCTMKDKRIIDLISLMEKMRLSVTIQLLDFNPFYFKDNQNKNDLWITSEHQNELNRLIDELLVIKKRKPELIGNSIASLEYIRTYFKDPKRADIPCYQVYLGDLWVDSEGKLFICQTLPPVGDLKKEKLEDIIFSEKYRKRLKRAFFKECPGCSCGYSTNVNYHFPNNFRYLIDRNK
jgi:MoaA/NifB/PqqE/SkfB family radical SAM enzyme